MDWERREFSGGVDDLAVVAVAFKFRLWPAVLGGGWVGVGWGETVTCGRRNWSYVATGN